MVSKQTCRWHEFDSRSGFEQAAHRFILEQAARAIAARSVFRIVLAGGETPRNIYRQLRAAATDWSAWHIYFGDERCVPAADPARNSYMAGDEWLHYVAIPAAQIHAIPAELGPDAAAAKYADELAQVGEFDLVLLGLGEDGHTASLFPGATWQRATAWPTVIPVHDAPKPPPQRVSLSPARLSNAARVIYLVSGNRKRQALASWRAGAELPAARIAPPGGVDVYINSANDLPDSQASN